KTRAQLLYGIPIWISALNSGIEKVQSTFLRRILGVPSCVGLAALYLEIGFERVETRVWIQPLKYWLRIHFQAEHLGYIYYLLSDSYISKWMRIIQGKIRSIGMPLDSILLLGQQQALHALSQRLHDIERQELSSMANRTCSPQAHGIIPVYRTPASYLSILGTPQACRACSPLCLTSGQVPGNPPTRTTLSCHMSSYTATSMRKSGGI
ncbi:hypothetical protein JRQ81_017906, partial [Phrynocephalus forsythii]